MDKKLKEIWLDSHGFNVIDLYPYELIYGLIYKNLLNEMCGFKFSGYEYIYIDIGALNFLPQSNIFTDFSTRIAVEFDIHRYKQADEVSKEQMVIGLYLDGLTKIGLRDGIDCSAINKVTEIAKQYRTKTLLNIKNIDTKKYSLKISIPAISWIQPEPVYLSFYQKSLGRGKSICIGTANMIQASVWLHKITVSSKTIRIKSSSAVRFVELLKNHPSNIEYNIVDLLQEKIIE